MPSPQPSRDPVIVAEPASEVQAAILRGVLEAEGIAAWIIGGLTSGFRAEAPGKARLLVRAQDAERAREILGRDARPGDRPDGDD
ncbi:MAG TPA: DUF2007 domain-containing protein [Phycisphaerales bacterium]|nr:DUF2007 domain-containing protein [Phycisphaerales bacterium]